MKSLILLLALCAAATAAQAQSPPAPPTPAKPPGPQVMYACPGGTDFSADFSDDGQLATLSVPGQPEIELSRQPSGTGFAYSDSYYELRGRGPEATLTGGGRSMRCHAVGRPGEPPRTFAGGGLVVTLFPDGTFRLRDSTAGGEPVLDLGQWGQEVDGGLRLVLRGRAVARRAFREVGDDRLVARNGDELVRAATPDLIEDRFRLSGLYRDSQNGGLFSECFTGRTFEVAPSGAEPDLERAWTEATPSKEAQLFVEIAGRLVSNEVQADQLIAMKRDGSCPPLAQRAAALLDTEWRMIEIDGEKAAIDDWRQRPRLKLEDDNRYTAWTGCNSLSGSYELDPRGLRFAAAAATLIGCAPPLAAAERRFIDALSAVREAQIAGTTLDLIDDAGKRRLRFEARGR